MMATTRLVREFGRRAFGNNPESYHAARPEYPGWVYDILVARCGLRRGASVLEIGAGTGIATHRLLELGAELIAIEPDQRLADFLRANNPDPALKMVVTPFEDAVLERASFDLAISATAFHWLDEDRALAKIADCLRPGGWWAAVWNVFGDDSRPDRFHEVTEKLLEAPASPSAGEHGIPFALDRDTRLAALRRNGAFDVVEAMTSQWSLILDADQTTALYATYSNVTARRDRDAVLAELGRIARDDFDNRVVRNMVTSLYIARRAA